MVAALVSALALAPAAPAVPEARVSRDRVGPEDSVRIVWLPSRGARSYAIRARGPTDPGCLSAYRQDRTAAASRTLHGRAAAMIAMTEPYCPGVWRGRVLRDGRTPVARFEYRVLAGDPGVRFRVGPFTASEQSEIQTAFNAWRDAGPGRQYDISARPFRSAGGCSRGSGAMAADARTGTRTRVAIHPPGTWCRGIYVVDLVYSEWDACTQQPCPSAAPALPPRVIGRRTFVVR
jgi:hypothetical protein